ncbi:MmgE/PrpD family protein [Hydrogenophaga sp.]|uniref:MmgE/PrpD family protein n=1 Tax=Hydrogenophaga sp. TaxID=1904254 RepID=UPI00271B5CE2|nr:MmgE/PrpD family protein [Hydrogenophaga sp.]MDO9435374.1 MmgE/PrpD family protein [Hydrogenophaga sp.]
MRNMLAMVSQQDGTLLRSVPLRSLNHVRRLNTRNRMPSASLLEICTWAQSFAYDSLATNTIDKAKLCLIDALSASMSIGDKAESDAALALVAGFGCGGASVVIGTSLRTAPSLAAFVNGSAAAGTARSDTHEASASHPGSVVIPAALALAEVQNASGRALIEAIVVGYEVHCRFGLALMDAGIATRFRPTGLIGPIGAAVASSKLLHLDPVVAASAAGLALNQMSGLNEWTLRGTSEHVLHSGIAARAGVESALLAQAGVRSAPSLLEGPSGALAAYGALSRLDRMQQPQASEAPAILGIQHKLAPACIFAQSPLQLAHKLGQALGDRVGQIDDIVASVSRQGYDYPGCNRKGPWVSSQAAKMSIRFAIASVLVHGSVSDNNWSDTDNPAVAALAARIQLRALDTLPSTAAQLEIRLTDRSVVCASQDRVTSTTEVQIKTRFLQACGAKLGERVAADILRQLESLEQLGSLRPLCSSLAA